MRGIGRVRAVAHQAKSHFESRRRIQWQQKINPSRFSTPVFLVGNGRSGTSMLVFHLTRSWHIDLFNEDNPAAFENWFLRDFETIDALVAASYAPIVLLKPIKDTYRIHRLQARFPNCKVLFSCRHFDDVINSSLKRFYIDFGRKVGKKVDEIVPPVDRWMSDDFAEYAEAVPPEKTKRFIRSLWREDLSLESKIALHWLFVNSLYFELGLVENTAVHLVKYESLVSQPDLEFKAICHFLDIPFEQKMITDVFASSINKKSAPNLDPMVAEACAALWFELDKAGEATL